MEYLAALSPLDDRYREKIAALLPFFSEHAFFSYRTLVEMRYLVAFLEKTGAGELSASDKAELLSLADLSEDDFLAIKSNEKVTNHDVKALEYFLRDRITNSDILPYIHFGLTSEDVNNIAYALMVADAAQQIVLPALEQIDRKLQDMADVYHAAPMLARTHGQPASPTTFGKEIRVFQHRLRAKLDQFKGASLDAKLNGATGNYSALVAAYPEIDWVAFSRDFINSFNKDRVIPLQPLLITTQVNSNDSLAALFDQFRQINTILVDLCQDMWRYISDGWLVQAAVPGEIGSSTMPHKVNPIAFENAEGNLGIGNALFTHFAHILPISRLQRDLSGSTVMRNIGVAFGHCLLAYQSVCKGISSIHLDQDECKRVLKTYPQVITEAIQVILKREGMQDAYEKLLEISRGKKVTQSDLQHFILSLDVNEKVMQELLAIDPLNYIGLADQLS